MVDIHTHILPKIDDGARNLQMTYDILQVMKEQGMTTVVASPHFYPSKMDKDDFVQKRQDSFNLIKQDEIKILKACELLFHPCVMCYENVDDLCIEGTRYILIELSYDRLWGMGMVNDIERFADKFNLKPIIVHVERYAAIKEKPELLDNLKGIGCLIQINGEGFDSFFQRRRLLKLINMGKVDIISSDTHDLTKRKPNLKKAYKYVQKALGEDTVKMLKESAIKVVSR